MEDQRFENPTVAWLCSQRHVDTSESLFDDGGIPLIDKKYTYRVGRMSKIGVVIAAPLDNNPDSMTEMVTDMLERFPKIRFRLLVGIGAGAPYEDDIRLGDVIVGYIQGTESRGGALRYTILEPATRPNTESSFKLTSYFKPLPRPIVDAVGRAALDGVSMGSSLKTYMNKLLHGYPRVARDRFFKADSIHVANCKTCSDCKGEVKRPPRKSQDPVVHYGMIASSENDMRDAKLRELLRQEEDILCFEEEAAGCLDDMPTLMIRGVCSYADTHKKSKNEKWQGYAAATAIAYSRGLLASIDIADIISLSPYQPTKTHPRPQPSEATHDATKSSPLVVEMSPSPSPSLTPTFSPMSVPSQTPIQTPEDVAVNTVVVDHPLLTADYFDNQNKIPKSTLPHTPPETPEAISKPQQAIQEPEHLPLNGYKPQPPMNNLDPVASVQKYIHPLHRIGALSAEDVDQVLSGPHCERFRNDVRSLLKSTVSQFGIDFSARSKQYTDLIATWGIRSHVNINAGGYYESVYDGMSMAQADTIASSRQSSELQKLRAARAHAFLIMNYENTAARFVIYDTLLQLWDYVDSK